QGPAEGGRVFPWRFAVIAGQVSGCRRRFWPKQYGLRPIGLRKEWVWPPLLKLSRRTAGRPGSKFPEGLNILQRIVSFGKPAVKLSAPAAAAAALDLSSTGLSFCLTNSGKN